MHVTSNFLNLTFNLKKALFLLIASCSYLLHMNILRFTFLFALAAFLTSCIVFQKGPGKQTDQKFTVSGSVTQTFTYCGGAAPPPELLQEMSTPSPARELKLFVRNGSVNGGKIIDSVVTDSAGHFSFSLPPGTYCIVEAPKKPKLVIPQNDKYTTWDADCLKKQWQTCDAQVIVKDKEVSDLAINFHRPCSFLKPCASYTGPMPPAAPPHH